MSYSEHNVHNVLLPPNNPEQMPQNAVGLAAWTKKARNTLGG